MNNYAATLLVMCLFFTHYVSPNYSVKNKIPDPPLKMVVTFEKLTSKDRLNLTQSLYHLEGITLYGFCQELNCYYFNYDPSIFISTEQAFESLCSRTKQYQPLLKLDSNIEALEKTCLTNP